MTSPDVSDVLETTDFFLEGDGFEAGAEAVAATAAGLPGLFLDGVGVLAFAMVLDQEQTEQTKTDGFLLFTAGSVENRVGSRFLFSSNHTA